MSRILDLRPIWSCFRLSLFEPNRVRIQRDGRLKYPRGVPLRVLSDLEIGERGVIVSLNLPPGVENHLMYMGFVPDAQVKAVHRAPVGDPTVYSVDGMEIALRRETARMIQVGPVRQVPTALREKREEFAGAIR